jgi:hypothetical protein
VEELDDPPRLDRSCGPFDLQWFLRLRSDPFADRRVGPEAQRISPGAAAVWSRAATFTANPTAL